MFHSSIFNYLLADAPPCLLFYRAHSSYLSSVGLAASGLLPEANMTLHGLVRNLSIDRSRMRHSEHPLEPLPSSTSVRVSRSVTRIGGMAGLVLRYC